MSLLISLCLKRSIVVDELVEAWQRDHQQAMFAHEVDELCAESNEVCRLCANMWSQLREQLFDCKVQDVDKTGRMALEAIEKALHGARRVLGLIADAGKLGFEINGAADLEEQVRNLEGIREKLLRKWPFYDHKMMEMSRESLADYARGDYQTVEEILHALQSGNSEEDQQDS